MMLDWRGWTSHSWRRSPLSSYLNGLLKKIQCNPPAVRSVSLDYPSLLRYLNLPRYLSPAQVLLRQFAHQGLCSACDPAYWIWDFALAFRYKKGENWDLGTKLGLTGPKFGTLTCQFFNSFVRCLNCSLLLFLQTSYDWPGQPREYRIEYRSKVEISNLFTVSSVESSISSIVDSEKLQLKKQ